MREEKLKTSGVKRKADSISRLGETASSSSGRGSVTGWTTCPLCGRFSTKMFALGRGIATHLHAVHTPWKPGKIELKKRRSAAARTYAESRRNGTNKVGVAACNSHQLDTETWDPSPEDIAEWDKKVLDIVNSLEKKSNEHLNIYR